jgi:hypothetical protein
MGDDLADQSLDLADGLIHIHVVQRARCI